MSLTFLRKHTTVRPTATIGGFFEQIVSAIVNDLDRRKNGGTLAKDPHRSMHQLVLNGLRVKVTEQPDGVLLFEPQVGIPNRKST